MQNKKTATKAQGASVAPVTIESLMAQIVAMQALQSAPATAPVKAKATKSAPKAKSHTGAKLIAINDGASFFVYGDQATAKLAPLFAKRPHLDRGFKEREITGVGKVHAYWFGGKQLKRVTDLLK